MPDVIEGILTPQDVFNLKVDTQRRWDSIDVPSNFSIPEPKFPDPLNTSTQMSVYDGLSSTDPKTKSLAEENLRQSIAQTPAVKYNNNFHIDTPYADAQKYYEGKFGFDPTRDNAQFYHENEYLAKGIPGRAWDNIWKGATRLVGGVVTKLGQTAGHLGSMVASSVMEIPDILTGSDNHNWLASWADNSFSKMMEGAEQHIKDVWAPIYKPSNWDQMGFFEKMTSGQAWSDDVVDGVAFMGEMIAATYITGAGLSKLGWAAKAGELSIEGSSMAHRLGRSVMLGATGSRNLGELGSWALVTVGESAFEAADGYKTIKQTLKDERAQGKNKFSDQEIENFAGSRAASRFRANLLALSISNAFQNRFIFQPLLKRMGGRGFTSEKDLVAKGISVADDPIALAEAQVINPKFKGVLDRYLNIPKKLSDPTGALRFYGSRALMATMMEGFWEENAQLAIERLSAKGKLTLSSFTDQYLKQTNDAIRGNDPENAMSIGLGALIGIGGTAIGAKAAKSKENPGVWGERKLMKLERQDMVNNYENMRKRYFSFGDVYEKDEKGNPIPEGNSFKIDPVKLAGLYKGLDDHMKSQYSMEEFKDPYLRKLAQNKLLSDFVFASKQAGISDTVIDRLEKLTNFSRQDLNKLGFNPDNKTDIGNTVDAYRKLSQIYEDVFTRRVSRPLDVRVADFEQSEFQRKGYLYNVKTDMLSISDVMQDYARLSSDKLLSKYKAGDETLGSIAQKHNSLQMELSSLLQTENVLSKASPYFNEYFKAKKESLKGQLKELEPLITDAALEDKMVFIPYSDDVTFLGSKEEYGKHIDEDGQFKQESLTEAREKFLQDFSEASKFSELQSALGMKTYVSDKISDKNKGHQNFQEYKAYIEAIQALDEKQDKKYTTQTSDDGKVYVVGPDGSEMTTVDTQEEADEIATELNTEKPEEPEEGGYRVVPYEDTFDLLDENGNIVANYQTEAAALEVAARRGKKVTTKPLVKKDVTKLNYEELLKEASAIIGRFTGAELTEEGIPNVANFLTDPSLELAREGLSQEETLVLNTLVKAYNDRMKTESKDSTEEPNSITSSDKIIFGHPTIGKSYLKRQGVNTFITLDDDYANEVNAFVDANRGSETRQEYKGRKPKEYNQFMLDLYDRLKEQARKEGKVLFVSNTNILRERMDDFDKVITMPKDEFKRRFDARVSESLPDEGILEGIKKTKSFSFGVPSGESSIEWEYETEIEGDKYKFITGIYTIDIGNGTFETYFDIDFTVNDSEDLINKDIFSRVKKLKPIINSLLQKSSKYSVDAIRIQATDEQGKQKDLQRMKLYERVMKSLDFKLLHKSEDGEALFYEKPKRGSAYDFEDWKSDIDSAISKVPTNKVINTTGYLADLFQGIDTGITESSALEETKEAAEDFLSKGADNALNEAKSQDIKDVEDDFDNSLGCK